jgi:fused signal recognition particle receptor
VSFLKIFSKSKISGQLTPSSGKISKALTTIFTHKKLDAESLEELENILISSDLGVTTTEKIISDLKNSRFSKDISEVELKRFIAEEVTKILKPSEKPLNFDSDKKPLVLVFNGVNGAGKTTTVGKIAFLLKEQGKKVLLVACDTFRSAAVEQLQVWANRSTCEIILPKKEGEDPASVAYRALDYGKQNEFDVLLIDTAGRMQNKQNLMDELKKINSVIKKIDAAAPHENLLILDATTGQNAKNQLEIFNKIVGITGLVVTKLDGTAKAGIVVALTEEFAKPIYAIGIGEKIEDLQEFNASEFAHNLVGITI